MFFLLGLFVWSLGLGEIDLCLSDVCSLGTQLYLFQCLSGYACLMWLCLVLTLLFFTAWLWPFLAMVVLCVVVLFRFSRIGSAWIHKILWYVFLRMPMCLLHCTTNSRLHCITNYGDSIYVLLYLFCSSICLPMQIHLFSSR